MWPALTLCGMAGRLAVRVRPAWQRLCLSTGIHCCVVRSIIDFLCGPSSDELSKHRRRRLPFAPFWKHPNNAPGIVSGCVVGGGAQTGGCPFVVWKPPGCVQRDTHHLICRFVGGEVSVRNHETVIPHFLPSALSTALRSLAVMARENNRTSAMSPAKNSLASLRDPSQIAPVSS